MRTRLAIAVLAGAVALAACTRTLDPPTAEDQARERHGAIVGAADTLLMGDRLSHFATDDDVERTSTTCRGDTCAAGFLSLSRASRFGIEGWELTLLRERRGVRLFRQELSGTDRDYEAYGGWLEHSLFATRLTRFADDAGSSAGASVVFGYSLGYSSGENPSAAEGSARWEGLMLGRDLRASPGCGQTIRGDAGAVMVNALAPEFHLGEGPSRYGRPGRIPGSVNVPAATLLNAAAHGAFVSLAEARRLHQDAGITPDRHVVAYCGGGISATVGLFLLHQLGYRDLTLYDGSMGDWAQDSALPIETGPQADETR